MALLSADDVLNKKFETTKFREGYDKDEVDDYLDEVVDTLRAVYAENEELKAKLEASEARVAELGSGSAAPVAEQADEQQDAPEESSPEETAVTPAVGSAPNRRSLHEAQVAQQTSATVAEPVAPAAAPAAPAAATGAPEGAAGMLAMAQRVHDEYVADGQAEASRLVAEATSESERIVAEAEAHSNRTLSQLEQERSLLERKIDELRTFERDYRTRLKSYLNQLLTTVEGGTGNRESGI
jgi:DivIVA domain-containing protein